MHDFFGTILLIDDLQGQHSYIKSGLERSNFLSAIVHVDSIKLAYAHLRAYQFDLIVIRAGLSHEGELGLLQTLKGMDVQTPILFVTGFGQTTIEFLANGMGMTTYRIINPGDAAPAKLVEAIQTTFKQWFERPKRLRQRRADEGAEAARSSQAIYAS